MNRICSAFCAVLLLLGLAACNEEPKPRFEPREPSETPSSPTTSTTTDPPEPEGPVEPEMPSLARKHTKKGAEAFAVHYWEMAEYALLTGDTKPLKALGTGNCEKCKVGVQYIDTVYRRGGVVRGGETTETVTGSREVRSSTARGYEVSLRVRNTKQTIKYPDDETDETYRPSTLTVRFFVQRVRDGLLTSHWEGR